MLTSITPIHEIQLDAVIKLHVSRFSTNHCPSFQISCHHASENLPCRHSPQWFCMRAPAVELQCSTAGPQRAVFSPTNFRQLQFFASCVQYARQATNRLLVLLHTRIPLIQVHTATNPITGVLLSGQSSSNVLLQTFQFAQLLCMATGPATNEICEPIVPLQKPANQ